MAATTKTAMYGICCNLWKEGYSAVASSSGAQTAVAAGIVPMAHGCDVGGSIRIAASWCGVVGLKASCGDISLGPVADKPKLAYSSNLVQAKSGQDVALALGCVSQPMLWRSVRYSEARARLCNITR